MPSLIPEAQREVLTGALMDHFDTFKLSLIVWRHPKETVTNINTATAYHGYRQAQRQTEVTLTPQSGVFEAIIVEEDKQKEQNLGAVPLATEKGMVRVKVKQDARDYINEQTVERIDFNDASFNLAGEEKTANYLGLKFYIFHLERTK